MSFYQGRIFLPQRFRLVLLSVLQAAGLPFSDVLSEEAIQSAFDEQDVSFAQEQGKGSGYFIVERQLAKSIWIII